MLAWVQVTDGRLLAARSRGQDLFYCPGGKREPGESDAAALLREIREELGIRLDAASARLLTVIVAPAHGTGEGRSVRMACYTAAPEPGQPAPRACGEIAEIAWVTATDRDRCAPADRVLIDELIAAGQLAPAD